MSNQRIPARDAAQAVHVVELNELDSSFVLLHDFGIADFADTEPAELTLVAIEGEPKTFAAEVRRALGKSSGHSRYDDLMFGTAESGVKA